MRGLGFYTLILLVLFALPAWAQEGTSQPSARDRTLPPLWGVSELAMADLTLRPVGNAEDCLVSAQEVAEAMRVTLHGEMLAAYDARTAPPQKADVLRLTLFPVLAVVKSAPLECVAWLSLSAQAAHTVRLPPNARRKTITVNYWERGGLVRTSVQNNRAEVSKNFSGLISAFIKDWRTANADRLAPKSAVPVAPQ